MSYNSLDDNDSSMSKPANTSCKDFRYYSLMIAIAEKWISENVDLRPAKQLITRYYYSDAIVTACDESNHATLIEELLGFEPISLNLLEKIAKQIKSDATLDLISQYRETTHASNQSQSTRNTMTGQSNFSFKLLIKKLCKFGWNHKITFAIITAAFIALGLTAVLAWYHFAITAAAIFGGVTADDYLAAGS